MLNTLLLALDFTGDGRFLGGCCLVRVLQQPPPSGRGVKCRNFLAKFLWAAIIPCLASVGWLQATAGWVVLGLDFLCVLFTSQKPRPSQLGDPRSPSLPC